jgi:hypothetical protein
MADKILLKRSLTSGNVPTTSSLDVGELAINAVDGKLFFKQSGSGAESIKEAVILNNPTSGDLLITGSINASSVTGSLFGTSSWSVSSSWAPIVNGVYSSSAQISQSGFVSSSTINTIQTITSASYAGITPVSGTLYIIID